MFIEKLEFLMKQKKLKKLSELAEASGVPYTTLRGFYDKGTDNIKKKTLLKLSSYFGCTMDYLANDDIPITHILHMQGISEEDYQKLVNEIKKDMEKDTINLNGLTDEEKENVKHIVDLMKK